MNKIFKNILYITLTVMTILFAVTCANPTIGSSTVQPSDLLTEQCKTMINRGDSIFDEVVESYDALENSNIKPYLQSLLDYQLFPYNADGVKTFNERMSDIYLSENNIVSAYTLFQTGLKELSTDTKSIPMVRKFVTNLPSRIEAPSLQLTLPFNNPVNQTTGNLTNLNSQQQIFQMEQEEEEKTSNSSTDYSDALFSEISTTQTKINNLKNNLSNQMRQINYDLYNFKYEARASLYRINGKTDEVILGLKSARHDISVISQDIQNLTNIVYLQDLKDPMAQLDGFLFNYATAGSWSSARDYALDILPQYGYILERFLDCAKSIQSWQKDQSGDLAIPAMVPFSHTYDSSSGVDLVRVDVYDAGNTKLGEVFIEFTNPQKSINVGLGNIQYLAKIMLTRFNIHNILYWGTKLADTNDSVATAYLNKLESSGIKPSVEAATTQMESELATYINDLSSDFTRIYPTATRFIMYKNDSLVGTSSTLTSDEQKAVLLEAYSSAFLNYLGPVMTTLMQLEIQLKSYQK